MNVRDGGRMLATCWCERELVEIDADMLKAGQTRSCRHPRCRPGCTSVEVRKAEQRERAEQAAVEYQDWLDNHAVPRRIEVA